MTLQQLNYAIAVAEARSFNKASELLYISQPSLSASIQELEKELGFPVFFRSGRGVTLTPEGSDFLLHARLVNSQYQDLLDYLGKTKDRKKKFSVSTQHYSFADKAFVEMVKEYDTSRYEFAIMETKTKDVISDVATLKSEIGILYLSDFNRSALLKLIRSAGLTFHHLIDCEAYVYLWKGHPLAKKKSIRFEDLAPYPCLAFDQGDATSFYYAEEILSMEEYTRIIKTNDRATMLNLMVGLDGYTLCSGIICEELNGSDYAAVPFESDSVAQNSVMEIGFLTKDKVPLSDIGQNYIEKIRQYLGIRDTRQET